MGQSAKFKDPRGTGQEVDKFQDQRRTGQVADKKLHPRTGKSADKTFRQDASKVGTGQMTSKEKPLRNELSLRKVEDGGGKPR